MVILKSILADIKHGSFPSSNALMRARNETNHSFDLLLDVYYQYLLVHELNEAQSKSIKKFFQTFFKQINYIDHTLFIHLVFIRMDGSVMRDIVRLVSQKVKNRCSVFLKAIGLLVETNHSRIKIIEDLIQYAFEQFKSEHEQKAIIDFLFGTLTSRDFLTAMIFCREDVEDKNYLELSCWFAIRSENFISTSAIQDLMVILPRLSFSTITDINIISDLSKHLRAFQTEINRALQMTSTVDGIVRKRLEFLHTRPMDIPPDDNGDLIDFYQNYKYGVK